MYNIQELHCLGKTDKIHEQIKISMRFGIIGFLGKRDLFKLSDL